MSKSYPYIEAITEGKDIHEGEIRIDYHWDKNRTMSLYLDVDKVNNICMLEDAVTRSNTKRRHNFNED